MFGLPEDGVKQEGLDINNYLVKNPDSTFFLAIETDGPEDSGVYAGDVLAVDKALTPEIGQLVILSVAGDLALRIHQPAIEDDDAVCWGVVVGLVRRL